MSIRQRATQCLGKHLPDNTHGRLCSPSGQWPGLRARWHEEQENNKLIPTSMTSERIFRSRETVKAWLESSPSSVIENQEDESACSSSFDSFSSSPAGSVDHLSYASRLQKTSPSNVISPGHTRARTISPPRRTANRNSVDVSRIDYGGGSFLMLAFKNAQYIGSSSPPAFLYTSENMRDDHILNVNAEECCSPRSEFSLTSEWQYILAAANAAAMTTRDSSGNDSELETSCEVLNISDYDLGSAADNLCAYPDVLRRPLRTRSSEHPPVKRLHDRSASADMKDVVDDDKSSLQNDSVDLTSREIHAGINYDQSPPRSQPRRNLETSAYMREAAEERPKREARSRVPAQAAVEVSKPNSRFESEKVETKFWEDYHLSKATNVLKQAESKLETSRAPLINKMSEAAIARRKGEEKTKAVAEAKCAEKVGRDGTEAKQFIRKTTKGPRGCLFLG